MYRPTVICYDTGNFIFICLGTGGESIAFKNRTACALLFRRVLQNQRRTTAAIPDQSRCIPVLPPSSTRVQHVFICKDFFTSVAAGGRSPV